MRSVRYSESAIRQVIRDRQPRADKGQFFFWDELSTDKKERILKNEFIPGDIEPIAVFVAKGLVFGKHCFVIGPDNVLYGDKVFQFPGGKLSFRDLINVSYRHGSYILRFADGSQITQPDNAWGKVWLQDFFTELVKYDSAVAPLHDPVEYDFADYLEELQYNSVRRCPDFILGNEMNYLEQAGVANLLPDVHREDLRGILLLNYGYDRDAYIAITEGQYRLNLGYTQDCVDLKQWDYFLASAGEDHLHFGRFREGTQNGIKAAADINHLRQTEELVDYQLATLHYNLYFDRMKTEPITREKANLICRSNLMMRNYWDNKAEYPWAENPRVLKIKIAFSNMTKDFDEIIFYYRLLNWAESDPLAAAYAGFISEFLQPLTVTTLKRMLYHVTVMESGYISEREFYTDDDRLRNYISNDFYGSSLIERRNELAERVNQLTGDSLDMPKLPVRDGYVMDWYMAQKHEWEKNCE